MRRRAPWRRPEPGSPGGGPADVATVVIAIDGSSTSRAAFSWGCGEARRLGGRAVAVFIDAAAPDVSAAVAATGCLVPDPPAGDHDRYLPAETLREAADLDLTFFHIPGNPVAGLLRVAGEVHADLIVVGAAAAIPRRRAGSVARHLTARRRESVIVIVPPGPALIEDGDRL